MDLARSSPSKSNNNISNMMVVVVDVVVVRIDVLIRIESDWMNRSPSEDRHLAFPVKGDHTVGCQPQTANEGFNPIHYHC